METSSDSVPVVLALDGVRKHFDAGGARIEVLCGVSLAVSEGGSLAVAGPSGSGKTTLLNIAGGIDRPDSGTVRILSQDLGMLSGEECASLRRQRIGWVFQQHHLLPQLTALENVLLPVLAGSPRATDAEVARARQLLTDVGLSNRTEHRPAQLSGGERQRVAVARAWIQSPALLVADEPTAALDRTTARDIARLLLTLARAKRTALLVATHDPELAAMLDRTLVLRDGQFR